MVETDRFETVTFQTNTRQTPVLSALVRRALDRHIWHSLRRRFGAGGNLRECVHRVVLELAGRGVSIGAIRAELIRSVAQHPQVHHLDRVSIVTGESTSTALTRQMLEWADTLHGLTESQPRMKETA